MKQVRLVTVVVAAIASLSTVGIENASAADGVRAALIEEIRNEQPPFMVRVSVDQADHTYEVGETMTVQVLSEQAGYLYLFYLQADKKISLLFPNRIQMDNRIPANQAISVPARDARFRIRIGAPTGQEILKAIVTKKPLQDKALQAAKDQLFQPVQEANLRAAYVEELKSEGTTWAEHVIELKTFPAGQSEARVLGRESRRVALCIGISQFTDFRIRDLSVCHMDADQFAQMLRKYCGFDEVHVLTNARATKAAIEKAVREKLVEATQPGDDVVIYWSGHGARIADVSGDEADGFDELLIPVDARIGSPAEIRSTTILDDTFGRWIQDLDGRRVLVVLDTCHSGGQSNHEKGLLLSDSEAGELALGKNVDFFDGELTRTKDIGQSNAALLASSKAREISLERREGDLSVMTYFFIEKIKKASAAIELDALHRDLERDVAEYVATRYTGVSQVPVLINELDSPFILNP